MKVSGTLTGFNDFEKLLKELPTRVQKKILQKSVTGAMREIRTDMRNAAPRDENGQSQASKEYGRLRKNIKVVKLKKTKPGEKGARITTGNAYWGYFYELGTRFQPARPWFRTQFASVQGKALKKLGELIGDGIEQEARKK